MELTSDKVALFNAAGIDVEGFGLNQLRHPEIAGFVAQHAAALMNAAPEQCKRDAKTVVFNLMLSEGTFDIEIAKAVMAHLPTFNRLFTTSFLDRGSRTTVDGLKETAELMKRGTSIEAINAIAEHADALKLAIGSGYSKQNSNAIYALAENANAGDVERVAGQIVQQLQSQAEAVAAAETALGVARANFEEARAGICQAMTGVTPRSGIVHHGRISDGQGQHL